MRSPIPVRMRAVFWLSPAPFTVNGSGLITGGVEDVNSAASGILGNPITGGSFAVGPDGRTIATVTTGLGTVTWQVTLISDSTLCSCGSIAPRPEAERLIKPTLRIFRERDCEQLFLRNQRNRLERYSDGNCRTVFVGRRRNFSGQFRDSGCERRRDGDAGRSVAARKYFSRSTAQRAAARWNSSARFQARAL